MAFLVFVAMFATQLITPARAETEAVSAMIETDKACYSLSEIVAISGWGFASHAARAHLRFQSTITKHDYQSREGKG